MFTSGGGAGGVVAAPASRSHLPPCLTHAALHSLISTSLICTVSVVWRGEGCIDSGVLDVARIHVVVDAL